MLFPSKFCISAGFSYEPGSRREKSSVAIELHIRKCAWQENEMNAHVEMLEEVTARFRAAHGEPLAGAETILFVEDEAFVRDVTCEVLRSAGYRVLTARNAVEAAREYDRCCGEVTLLLTDVILPGETGRELAGRLRRANPGLKVLLVTGYAEQMGLRDAGPEKCLAKPFSTGMLLRRVRQAIDCGEFRGKENQIEDEVRRACGNE
jgi:CheY-like chemotaxis protein